MPGQPEDWEPELNVLYQCINCDTLFARPEPVIMFGETIWRCPECYDIDFFSLATEVVWGICWDILAQGWNESERAMLRLIAEHYMGPFNPISRDL